MRVRANVNDKTVINDGPSGRLLQLLSLTESEAAAEAELGIPSLDIKKIIETNEIDRQVAEQIQESSGICADWLMTGKGPPFLQSVHIEGYRGSDSDLVKRLMEATQVENTALTDDLADQFLWVKKAGSRLSAGGGIIPQVQLLPERYAFRQEYLRAIATSPHNVLLMDIEGESMEPTFSDGDTVLIDRGRTEIRDGCVYALALGDVIQFKRLTLLPKHQVRVASDNPGHYDYTADLEEISVIGEWIWLGRTNPRVR
jgi:phage repressor protein C with HTH and peptisase S24 domain